jgi:hypothetical protein
MKIEIGWIYGTQGRKERCIQCLVERPAGKRPLGRPCHKGNDIRGLFTKYPDWNCSGCSLGGMCLQPILTCLYMS